MRYEVAFRVFARGGTVEGDCYYGEEFHGSHLETKTFECQGGEEEALIRANKIAREEFGEFVSLRQIS